MFEWEIWWISLLDKIVSSSDSRGIMSQTDVNDFRSNDHKRP